jgi:alanine racemase
VISTLKDLESVLEDRDFSFFPLCIKLNTGMNRLGISYENSQQVIDLLKKYKRDSVYHLLSHFCCASLSVKNRRTQVQYERFKKIKDSFKQQGIHIENSSMANSGAIEQRFALEETHIRPGLMLYGPSALTEGVVVDDPWQGELIGSFKTYVINSFDVTRGEPIGYGGIVTADEGKIALLAVGYGDGIPTYFQGAPLYFNGHEGKVFGRVNMDMIQVFFHKKDECPIRTGDTFTLWGESRENFDMLCRKLKVIPYELLCLVSSRIPRLYKK